MSKISVLGSPVVLAAIEISNLVIGPGSVLTAHVSAAANPASYILTLYSITLRQSVTLEMSPPSGTQLQGDSIEWIVERPTKNGDLIDLADFGQATWMDMGGSTTAQNGQIRMYRPSSPFSGTSYIVTMSDASGFISIPALYSNGDYLLIQKQTLPLPHPRDDS